MKINWRKVMKSIRVKLKFLEKDLDKIEKTLEEDEKNGRNR